MCYQHIPGDHMIRGTVLAIVDLLFPSGAPTPQEYALESGVSVSSFRRAAKWLLGLLPEILRNRRPGPQKKESDRDAREEALRKLEDLRAFLKANRSDTEKNDCYRAEAKQRIASIAEEIASAGTLCFAEIAKFLGLNERQLYRIRTEVKEKDGDPEPKSRRPKNTSELCEEIQRLIRNIEASGDSKDPYTAADITRILKKNYKAQLCEHHGSETISPTTVAKYMVAQGEAKEEDEKKKDHPRGKFHYPEPFQQVAIDTSHFKLFGRVFYLITVFELGGRLNLQTRVFLRENTEAVVSVVEESFEKYGAIEAMVIDRGTPYLNAEVKAVLEKHGKYRIVAPPATPTAKAAAERHFRTAKEVLRPAVEEIFPEDPGWEPEQVARALELAIAVFQRMYHHIPQEGIDGKTPAERCQEFDPVRACASRIDLFRRSLESEPVEDYARQIHMRFQVAGSVEETVKRLRQFGTCALRKALERLSPWMGPPLPECVYDPVGLIAATAREIHDKSEEEFLRNRYIERSSERDRETYKEWRAQRETEDKARNEHPERFVDPTLAQAVNLIERKFDAGLRLVRKELKELLTSLSAKLKSVFPSEVNRLKSRIAAISDDAAVREKAERFLDELAVEITTAR